MLTDLLEREGSVQAETERMAPAEYSPTHSRRVILAHRGVGSAGWITDLGVLIESRGLDLCRLDDGRQAIRSLQQAPAEALILSEQDGILSEQGGGDELACWRIIRELRANLPCVYVARRATQRFLEQALSLSVTSVLTHPVESVILAGVMESIFDGRMGCGPVSSC